MKQKIQQLIEQLNNFQPKTAQEVEDFRIFLLGKKGQLNALLDDFKQVAGEEKRELGQLLNQLKQRAQQSLADWKQGFAQQQQKTQAIDVSLPASTAFGGSRHPLHLIEQELVQIFATIGFSVASGPEVEDDWHNFSALNFPPDHPARDMQDTFFTQDGRLLRTHTSSVQVRTMESSQPPIRVLSPGRVYRNEAVSTRSHCIFHQIEGLYIDRKVSMVDLRQTLSYFTQAFFGKSQIRLRPSYFPFTEPSAEVDVYWGLSSPADYRITKGTGWLEIMGCGMVDPNVLRASGIDPEEYSGFAFGMGIERIAMLRYQVQDIRWFFENDLRFLGQF